MKKDDRAYLKHILESIGEIELFIKGISKSKFLSNSEKQAAVLRMIEIIGEAAKNVSIKFKEKYPEVPWSYAVRTRDKLVHHYFGVDLNTVWDIIQKDIPDLKRKIKTIIEEIEKPPQNVGKVTKRSGDKGQKGRSSEK